MALSLAIEQHALPQQHLSGGQSSVASTTIPPHARAGPCPSLGQPYSSRKIKRKIRVRETLSF